MCCTTHFKEELLEKGVSIDISLAEERLDSPFGVEAFLWLPTEDHKEPTPCQMELGTSFLKIIEQENKKAYVHCRHGHGRAPTLVAAHFIKNKGLSAEEAVARIKEKRPTIHPNMVQMSALQRLQKE